MQNDIVILTLSLPKGKNPRILLAVRYITPSLILPQSSAQSTK
jgi:hypothetical protein